MAPEVAFTFAPGEERYAVTTTGPGGQPASSGQSCGSTGFPSSERIRYQGNGTYTVTLRVTDDDSDTDCAAATTKTFTFVVNAATSISPPSSPVLRMRSPDQLALNVFQVPVDVNPGADAHELRYAPNATLGADGGIAGEFEEAGVSSNGVASITFDRPGTYTMVARARIFVDGEERFTAWSAPVTVRIIAPFDLITPTFPDARGPSYRLAGVVRETSTKGKITISIGKGGKPKKFRRLGTAKIRKGGRFSLRFKVTKFGRYTLRYVYKGSATTERGDVRQVVTIRRTFS
jgi:hypothetical protein